MKKILTILAVTLVAGASQAAVIYSNDFSSGTTYTDSAFGCRIGDETIETSYNRWYTATTAGITNGMLQVPGASFGPANATTPRAGVIVLSNSTPKLVAGTYKLSWKYILWNNAHTDVQVWNAQAGTGDTNYFLVKYTDSNVTSNQVIVTNSATKEFLAGYSYTNTTGKTVTNSASIEFTFDGTGDIALMFGAAPNTSNYAITTRFDNMKLELENVVRLLILDK